MFVFKSLTSHILLVVALFALCSLIGCISNDGNTRTIDGYVLYVGGNGTGIASGGMSSIPDGVASMVYKRVRRSSVFNSDSVDYDDNMIITLGTNSQWNAELMTSVNNLFGKTNQPPLTITEE